MDDVHETPLDMAVAMLARAHPAITEWERVRGIPRAHDMSRALRAEVRDPLWMLARQWQLGEFIGDDAGSPVFAKLHVATTRLTTYQAKDQPEELLDDSLPLEPRVERRGFSFETGGQAMLLNVRLLMGRQWQKLLAKEGLGPTHGRNFQLAFPIKSVAPSNVAHAAVCAHREAWQVQAAFADRAMDGYLFYRWLVDHPAPRDFTTLPPPLAVNGVHAAALAPLSEQFLAWFGRLFEQAGPSNDAWDAQRLEYRVTCSAPVAAGRKGFVADRYYRGDLDWYAFDASPPSNAPASRPEVIGAVTRSFIPAQVEFNGMANTRYWALEDRRVNLGGIQPDTTDVPKLLLMEFAIVYANDWCLVPLPLTAGTVANLRGLAVTNVFGERLWIQAAASTVEGSSQRFGMFTLSDRERKDARDDSLLVLPTVPKVQEGAPFEACLLVRDEMANMVWGVETTVPLPSGVGRDGDGRAAETRDFFNRLLGQPASQPPLPNDAKARYSVMNSVPENWIPFVPVHLADDARHIQLQRGGMPRIIEGSVGPPAKVSPRTSLLRPGLDQTSRSPYYLHEAEVPRAGARVTLTYQRARWQDGRAVVWLGARKQVGRGEGSSGLVFDQLLEVKDK